MRPPARWAGPAMVAMVFAIFLIWSWGKWPDVLIDFGRELYVPWQLAKGKRLYADVAYFNGPLSPTLNAALFRMFGTGIRTLAIANAAVAALIAVMIHTLLRILTDRLVATVGTIAFFVFFAFAQFMPGGNYNYITPYSHEMTHGTALATAALLLLAIHLRRGGTRIVFALGATVGLIFLTKAEFVIAIVPAITAGLVLHHRFRRTPAREARALAVLFAAGAIVPPAVALLLLLTQLPPGQALSGLLGSWRYVFNPEVGKLRFYREILGTEDLGESFMRIGAWTLRYAVVFVPASIVGLALRRASKGSPVVVALLTVATTCTVLAGRKERDWENLATPFPLMLVVVLVVLAIVLTRRPDTEEQLSRWILGFSCTLYALVLLLKMILNTRILHYGFVLAMPAGLVLIATCLSGVPRWLDRRGRHGTAFRWAMLGAFAAFGFVQVKATDMWLKHRTVVVSEGRDRFVGFPEDVRFVRLLARIGQLRGPNDTLAVLPEGVMLNYLLRADNPTPYFNFVPPEIIMFGEDPILTAFESHQPDWIVLVNRSAAEYGYRFIGDDYGRKIMSWVEANYEPVDRIFDEDMVGHRQAFAAILRRAR